VFKGSGKFEKRDKKRGGNSSGKVFDQRNGKREK
jgi:hypothetical protein